MSDTVILIPTYNERENIGRLLESLVKLYPELDILIIDDNSTDGTIDVIRRFSELYSNIHYIIRVDERGLGSALLRGYREAIKRGYKYLIQMDADLQHDPIYIRDLIDKLRSGCDIVIASRYIEGGGVEGWSLRRRIISWGANKYVKILLCIKARDVTSGYRGFNLSSLKEVLDNVEGASGFVIQVETLYQMTRSGYRICEVPFIFKSRIHGSSKLSLKVILEFFIRVLKLRFLME